MKIGIDLDEVLVNFMPCFLSFYEEVSGKKFPLEGMKSYSFWENGVGKDREEAIQLVDRFFESRASDELPLMEGAREAVSRFSEEGKVWIITLRPERYRRKTENLIRKNFPEANGNIVYTGDFHGGNKKTKAEACLDLGIDELYEDNLHYARVCANYVSMVYLFDKPWNQGKVKRNIFRVKNWREVLGARR